MWSSVTLDLLLLGVISISDFDRIENTNEIQRVHPSLDYSHRYAHRDCYGKEQKCFRITFYHYLENEGEDINTYLEYLLTKYAQQDHSEDSKKMIYTQSEDGDKTQR